MEHADLPTEVLTESPIMQMVDEIGRYLDAVALFRALGCEPHWRSELGMRSAVIELVAPYITCGPG
jgi:hypothetical protein